MPRITAELDNEPLFNDDDPLVLVIPGVGEWRLSDYEVNPPNDDELNPETRPLTYIVEMVSRMAWETPEDLEAGRTPKADDLAEKLADALEDGTLTLTNLSGLLNAIGKETRKAVKTRTAKASGRPTRGRRR